MADYPDQIHTFIDPSTKAGKPLGDQHIAAHKELADEARAVQLEIGVNPSGTYPSVAERLSAMAIQQGVTLADAATITANHRPFTKMMSDLSVNGSALVVVEGDSKASGVGAMTLAGRWQEKLCGLLRTAHAPAGDAGVGFVPWTIFANHSGLGPGSRTTISGTRNDSAAADWAYLGDGGPGWQGIQLDTVNAVVTVDSLSVRYLSVEYTTRNDLFSGTFQVKSNGSVIGTINTNVSGDPTSTWWNYDFGTVANRVITIHWVSGHPRTSGAMFRTADTGISVMDAAHSGGTADQYFGHPLSTRAVQAFPSSPSLLITALGSNDLSEASWSTMASDLKAHLDVHWALNSDMGVIFSLSPPRPGNVNPDDPKFDPGRWSRVFGEIYDLIGNDPRVALWTEANLYTPFPLSGAARDPWNLTFFNDGVHWNPFANDVIAKSLMRDLLSY